MSRIVATSPLTIYVNADTGNDEHSGLTASDPLQGLQAAWDLGATQYDMAGWPATIQLHPASAHYGPLASALGWLGVAGYFGLTIQGDAPNSASVIVDGGVSAAFALGPASAGGVQCNIRNLSIRSPSSSGVAIYGSGNGAIVSNVTFLGCLGAAITCAHGAEAAFQYYILFLGDQYQNLAQAVTGGRFTGGETAVWAIGKPMTVTQSTLYCAGPGSTMNLGGLVSVNPRLVSGNQVGADMLAGILTGGNLVAIPGELGTASGPPYVNNGSVVS